MPATPNPQSDTERLLRAGGVDLSLWSQLSRLDRIAYEARMEWVDQAHPYQLMPSLDEKWLVWLLLAGRGAGKTRCAAEASWWTAWTQPRSRFLVLAPTSNDVKHTCFEGESGLLSVIPEELISHYNRQDFVLTLKNSTMLRGISADAYERLRGPQWHFAWADELAAFQYIEAGQAWDMMMFGLRLGKSPRVIATTTPKQRELIVELIGREGDDVIIDRATTHANLANLAPTFKRQIESYKGTKLYRQEVLGELIDLEDGKVVSRDMFRLWPAGKPLPKFLYIVQSYDCAFTDKGYNDPTACTTWGVFQLEDGPTQVLLIDCWSEHLAYPDLKARARKEYQVVYGEEKAQRRADLLLIEDKAAGISLVQELQRAHLPVRAWNPGAADKMMRLQIAAAVFVSGRVWLPESAHRPGFVRDWCEGFLSQLCAFPDATHDDYVDSASQAMRYLKDAGFLELDPPLKSEDDGDDFVDYTPESDRRRNPYD